jgi:putative glutathione S-transferase
MLQLETNFSDFVKADAPDLYPENLRAEIDALNAILLEEINQGVYKVKTLKLKLITKNTLIFFSIDLMNRCSPSRPSFSFR